MTDEITVSPGKREVNEMMIPGFSAEASLYEASSGYRVSTAAGSPTNGRLVPQQEASCIQRCNNDGADCIEGCDLLPVARRSACRYGCIARVRRCVDVCKGSVVLHYPAPP
jgi:hypothetical protein